jgi:methionyl-tRNA formyltransferase
MKIVLFLNKDLQANIAYNLLKSELLKHNVRIYYSDAVGNPNKKSSTLLKLEYFEKGFLFDELPTFLNKNKIQHSFDFFDANFDAFPFEKCSDVNSVEFINKMQAFNPDLFISIRFGKIFKDAIIQIPKNGLINLHSAILPDYKGIMGTLQAIKDGKSKIGCTLHTIPDSGIDTGEIIEIGTLDVTLEKSLFWNIIQLYPVGTELIIKNLRLIEQRKFPKTHKQNLQEGRYFSVPSQADFEEMERLGIEIISVEDYIAILTSYIIRNMSDTNYMLLTKFIKQRW